MFPIVYLVPFIIVLSVVVFFHEFGHFIVGRWCGAKVDAFSIGFGPELWARVDKHGTRWRIAAIPLGGYVKFHGDANVASAGDSLEYESMPAAERAVTFFGQSVAKRAAIVFAGPFANFVLAIAIYAGLFAFYGHTKLAPKVASLVEDGAGKAAGFLPGDIVVSIDGSPIDSFTRMQEVVSGAAGKTLVFVVQRDAKEITFSAVPALREVDGPLGKVKIGMLGLHASNDPADIRQEHCGPVSCFTLAIDETWAVMTRTYAYLGGLVTGRESAEALSGPIGIAQVSGQVAQAAMKVGLWPFFNLIAILSISIGLLNLMPVPLLDGGQLMFFAIEALRGKALNERAQEFAFRIGLAMVCSLMVFSTYNDIARLLRKFAGAGS